MITHQRDLSTEFCGVHFRNPFLLSAAPPTDDLDMVRAAFDAGWGGAVKGVPQRSQYFLLAEFLNRQCPQTFSRLIRAPGKKAAGRIPRPVRPF